LVREKAGVAHDLIKSHSLTPELSAELFAQKEIGAFSFSAALIKLLQNEVEGLQKIYYHSGGGLTRCQSLKVEDGGKGHTSE